MFLKLKKMFYESSGSGFGFSPNGFKGWVNNINEDLVGEQSQAGIVKRLNGAFTDLVKPGVWSGYAAYENYNDFKKLHDGLVEFIKQFAQSFNDTVVSISSSIGKLEGANAGVGDISMPALEYDDKISTSLENMAENNINQEQVKYDTNTIVSILNSLESIEKDFAGQIGSLKRHIGNLGSDDNFSGAAAEEFKTQLTTIVEKYSNNVESCLSKCVNNLRTIVENVNAANNG